MPKRKCKFTDDLRKKYPFFRSGREVWEAECMTCSPGTFVSVANHGVRDLEIHIKSDKHSKCVRGASSSGKVTNYFVESNSALDDSVCAAEGALAFHTVAHHNSYNSMDCTPKLLKDIFSDSKIAGKVSSGRTKTEAIVNSVLAPHSVETIIKSLQDIPFIGISTDASNHGHVKVFPIVVQYFDYENGGLQVKVLNVESKPNETAETIAAYVSGTLNNFGLQNKCVAFGGDNCNTMFGGLRRGDGNNVFANLKRMIKPSLIGIGCPAHILNNCIQHGTDLLDIDLQSLILKVYNYFSIYTVRVESLKDFCQFVDIEYQQLLYHSKTRWLSLFPAIQRLLQMFPALKSFFLSQDKPPAVLKKFFEDPFSEIYLWHIQSLITVFHSHISEIEKEDNSLIDVMKILSSIQNILEERKNANFIPLKVKDMLKERENDGFISEIKHFYCSVETLYQECFSYLEMWSQPFTEFSSFKWLDLEDMSWESVENSIKFLADKEIQVDDTKCFDQFCNLKTFIASYNKNLMPAQKKWCDYIKSCRSVELYSEIVKIAQFFFAIPAHNASVERLFSLIQSQWTKERNRLTIDSVKGIALVKFNYRHLTCKQFYEYLHHNKEILKKIRSSEKYAWAQK